LRETHLFSLIPVSEPILPVFSDFLRSLRIAALTGRHSDDGPECLDIQLADAETER